MMRPSFPLLLRIELGLVLTHTTSIIYLSFNLRKNNLFVQNNALFLLAF
jgi:hypothetical protein